MATQLAAPLRGGRKFQACVVVGLFLAHHTAWAEKNPSSDEFPDQEASHYYYYYSGSTEAPTSLPTSPPTTADTMGVSVTMSVDLGGWLSASAAEDLKDAIADAVGVDAGSVVDFSPPTGSVAAFAVTDSASCAEALSYGPCGSAVLTEESSPTVCTDHKDTEHSVWLQSLYDNGELQYSVRWEFQSGPKTLEQRFVDAVASGEEVLWTVTPGANNSFGGVPETSATAQATWRFSNGANIFTGGTFDSSSSSWFSADDGVWGAAPYDLDANGGGSLSTGPNSWGQQNYDSADSYTCNVWYADGVGFTSQGIKNVMALEDASGSSASSLLTFSIVASLAQTGATSTAEFAADVEAALADASFQSAVAAVVPGSVVDASSIAVVKLPARPGGTCFSGDSVVLVKNQEASAGGGVVPRRLTEVKAGDLLLAVNHQREKHFAAVKSLPHSPSVGDFIDIRLASPLAAATTAAAAAATTMGLRTTEHHTFPTCESPGSPPPPPPLLSPQLEQQQQQPFQQEPQRAGNLRHSRSLLDAMTPLQQPHHQQPLHQHARRRLVAAHELKAGDCLLTVEGERTVASATRRLAEAADVTYTVELEGATDLLVVGGVVTHAKPAHAAAAAAGQGRPGNKLLRSPSAALSKQMSKIHKSAHEWVANHPGAAAAAPEASKD